MKRLKYLVTCLDGSRIPLNSQQRGELQGEIPYWGANGIVDYLNDWLFDEPLVLLGEDGAPFFEPHKPVAFYVEGKVWVNNHAHVLRPKAVNPKFLSYALNVVDYSWFVEGTTRDKLTQGKMVGIPLPVPPAEEQRAIAAFLDSETAYIDALIAKKQRLIELLEEKRIAFISHAVTKGLNPAAPMKPSSIEWLGSVPSHWTVLPLKFVAAIQTGLTLGKKYDQATTLSSRPYLRVANVQDGFLDLDNITQVDLPSNDAPRYQLRPGDMLMTEGGDFDKLGRGYVWEGQISGCLHQNHIFAVRPDRRRLDSHFLAYLTSSSHGKAYFTSTSSQTTNLASTNSTKLKGFPVLLPPLDEQQAALSHISSWVARHDRLVDAARKGVEELREYRSALIFAAVTGKIDVHGKTASPLTDKGSSNGHL